MSDTMIRWKSLSGVGLVLVLLYGVLNVGAALAVPMMLEKGGGDAGGGTILAQPPEEFMLGTTYKDLRATNPKLEQLLTDSMLGMCSQMMAYALAYLAIGWYAARRGAKWAPPVLLVSGVIWVPYYFIIAKDIAAFGYAEAFKYAYMVSAFAIPAALGSALLLIGGRTKAAA